MKGHLVQLISGGPVMTVENTSQTTGGVKCVWFDANDVLQEKWFNATSLCPASEKPKKKTKS